MKNYSGTTQHVCEVPVIVNFNGFMGSFVYLLLIFIFDYLRPGVCAQLSFQFIFFLLNAVSTLSFCYCKHSLCLKIRQNECLEIVVFIICHILSRIGIMWGDCNKYYFIRLRLGLNVTCVYLQLYPHSARSRGIGLDPREDWFSMDSQIQDSDLLQVVSIKATGI